MGILDEAIREHLELKRQHGAADSELKQLEDEAFGAAERPGEEPGDQFAEAPTEFMAQPGEEGAEGAAADEGRSLREEAASRVADLQEPPARTEPEIDERPPGTPEPGEEERPAAGESAGERFAEPTEEEQPAAEHEAVPPEQIPEAEEQGAAAAAERAGSGPSTEERRAIADQPTELYDVEGEEISAPDAADASAEEDDFEDEDDEFWNEQRLSDELDQALEAPPADRDEPEAIGGDEREAIGGEEPEARASGVEPAPPAEEESEPDRPATAAEREDLLEETPDFLEESPEDDELWFEQKPPKDFDFDD